MDKKLYKLMDWPTIEGIIYADDAHPEQLLASKHHGANTLIQCFFKGAESVEMTCSSNCKMQKMECADADGYFATLFSGKMNEPAYFTVHYPETEKVFTTYNPYDFVIPLDEALVDAHHCGDLLSLPDFLGANATTISGVKGILYRVYAPMAKSASIVINVGEDDEYSYLMCKNDTTGIFSIFLPELTGKENYLYEIRKANDVVVRKLDPLAETVCDKRGMKASTLRKSSSKYTPVPTSKEEPFLLYELDAQKVTKTKIKALVSSIKTQGFTHVSVGNLLSERLAYGVHVASQFYAATVPANVKSLISELHKAGLRVVADYAFSCFDGAEDFLAGYDGSCIYEHLDARQGYHPKYQACLFNYDRGETQSYLLSSVLSYVDTFALDGLRICDTSFLLYLDYDKQDGQWIPNMYGGNENLSAIEFLKKMVRVLQKERPGIFLISDEFSGWQNLTSPQNEDGFGFDLKWNHAYTNELGKYLAIDPISRSAHHHELTMSYLYQKVEDFVLSLQKDAIVKCPSYLSLHQDDAHDVNRLLYAYTMLHPGKKAFTRDMLMTLSGDFISETNALYLKQEALTKFDGREEGLEWINSISANECVLVFLRKAERLEDSLLVCVNMAGCDWNNHKIGVPLDGKYKQLYVSENVKYGGSASLKNTLIKCKEDACDMRSYSIRVNLPALSVSVYSYVPYTEAELADRKAKEEEKKRKEAEAKRKKELLRKEKEKIRKTMKEKLAKEIAKAEEAIAKGSEFVKKVKKS